MARNSTTVGSEQTSPAARPTGTGVPAYTSVIRPASAVITGSSGEEAAFIVEDGKAFRREVETGLVSEGRVEIVSGLAPGEIVVTEGGTSLREGAAVRAVGSSAAAEAPVDSVPAARPGS